MNQAELINAISAQLGNVAISKSSIKLVLEAQGDVIQAELHEGGEAVLPGIGKLSVKTRPARKGRNPSTGEEMDIPAKNVPHFSAAKTLKDAVA